MPSIIMQNGSTVNEAASINSAKSPIPSGALSFSKRPPSILTARHGRLGMSQAAAGTGTGPTSGGRGGSPGGGVTSPPPRRAGGGRGGGGRGGPTTGGGGLAAVTVTVTAADIHSLCTRTEYPKWITRPTHSFVPR